MFYTKYRPQKFSEVSKPNETVDSLVKQVINGKTVHAYLFVGPRGTGKTTTARILAKALNCTNLQENGDPCDKCDNCIAIRTGNFLDLMEIDAASNRGIDDIRDLRDKVKLAPSIGKRKIYIIDEVHMLTNEAFNALLKTLEEPPKHVTFILCTTELHKVPETVKSRCQVFKIKRATLSQLVEKLASIAKAEKAKIDKEDLKKIASASLGGFRDAETLLQQVIEGSLKVDTLFSVGSKETYYDFVEMIREKDVNGAVRYLNKIFDDGTDLYVWTGELLKYLRDLLFISAMADEGLIDTTDDVYEKMRAQGKSMSSGEIVRFLNVLITAQNSLKSSFITQLPLEIAIVDLCDIQDDVDGLSMNKPTQPKKNPSMSKDIKKIDIDADKEKSIEDKKKASISKKTSVEDETVTKIKVSLSPKKSEEKEEETEDDEISPLLPLEKIAGKWNETVSNIAQLNTSLSTLIRSGKPIEVKGNTLVIEVSFPFHKERIEFAKNRKIVEGVLKELHDVELRIKCAVNESLRPKKLSEKETGVLTDQNVAIPAVAPENALDLFDGGLAMS